jgi:hypothetical protein
MDDKATLRLLKITDHSVETYIVMTCISNALIIHEEICQPFILLTFEEWDGILECGIHSFLLEQFGAFC